MNIANQIRKVLREAGIPMSIAQMAETLNWSPEDRTQASKTIHPMKTRGELIATMEENKLHYALNPKWDGKTVHRDKRQAKATSAAPSSATPVPAASKANTALLKDILDTVGKAPVLAEITNGDMPSPIIPALQAAIDRYPKGALSKRPDLDLHKRIDAIAVDIEEAINDAFDADHGKELIKFLFTAHASISRAARMYPRT